MTDLPTGAHAPGTTSEDEPGKAKQVAERGRQAAGEAVSDVKDTATQQAQRVRCRRSSGHRVAHRGLAAGSPTPACRLGRPAAGADSREASLAGSWARLTASPGVAATDCLRA